MTDLRRRFRSLDSMPAPDLWDEVERRVEGATTKSRDVWPSSQYARRPMDRRAFVPQPLLVALLLALLVVAAAAGAFIGSNGFVRTPLAEVTPLESAYSVYVSQGAVPNSDVAEVAAAARAFAVEEARSAGGNPTLPRVVSLRLLLRGEEFRVRSGSWVFAGPTWVVEVDGVGAGAGESMDDRLFVGIPDTSGEGTGFPIITGADRPAAP